MEQSRRAKLVPLHKVGCISEGNVSRVWWSPDLLAFSAAAVFDMHSCRRIEYRPLAKLGHFFQVSATLQLVVDTKLVERRQNEGKPWLEGSTRPCSMFG
jgi:hypothetical protein